MDHQRGTSERHSCGIAPDRHDGSAGVFCQIQGSQRWHCAFDGRREHWGRVPGLRVFVFADIIEKNHCQQIFAAKTARFMKPSHLFGVIVRVIGVLLWIAAMWQFYRAVLVLAGRTSWVDTYGHAVYDHLLPAVGLVAAGFALIRGAAWLRRFSYFG
jgi:hypothetical protein